MSMQQPPADDAGKHESIKVERNSKGYNWAIRLVKQEGQTDADWLRRLADLNREMQRQYGQQA